MKFASVRQIIIMVAVSCVALFALDYFKNPQLWHPETVAAATARQGVRLTLWMNHMCCTSCLDDVRQALVGVPGLDATSAVPPKGLLTQAQADQLQTSLPDYGNAVEFLVTDLDKLDLVAVDRALRDKGLVAGRMELSGVEHFRLAAKLNHGCCATCNRASRERVDFMRANAAGGQFRWLDSVDMDLQKKTIVAYARYLQPGKSVDVEEFLTGLNDIGFAPVSIQVLAGDEMNHATHQASTAD